MAPLYHHPPPVDHTGLVMVVMAMMMVAVVVMVAPAMVMVVPAVMPAAVVMMVPPSAVMVVMAPSSVMMMTVAPSVMVMVAMVVMTPVLNILHQRRVVLPDKVGAGGQRRGLNRAELKGSRQQYCAEEPKDPCKHQSSPEPRTAFADRILVPSERTTNGYFRDHFPNRVKWHVSFDLRGRIALYV